MSQIQLTENDFISLNLFTDRFPIQVDMVYAQEDHPDNHFSGLYHPDAKNLWVHKILAPVILLASVICHNRFKWTLKLNGCLRPVEAQEKMAEYGYPPELVSTPGAGAHPRGMAIDVQPVWHPVMGALDMGTDFDHFARDLSNNPAARDAVHFEGRIDGNCYPIFR